MEQLSGARKIITKFRTEMRMGLLRNSRTCFGRMDCVQIGAGSGRSAKELFGGSPFIKCRLRVFPTHAVVAGQAPKDSERTLEWRK